MSKSARMATLGATLIVVGVTAAYAQGMLLDYAADRVIQKCQTSTCEQLKARRAEPKSEKELAALRFLHDDSQARMSFIDRIAAPVANKMFECDMFP
ncbi:MAG TPA: hypothetical protein VK741_24290 [Acetobacteraceae bacterium]|nr:hypothetical protein [Acetobacteraceae bacterium]